MNTAIILLVAVTQLLHQHIFCYENEAANVLCLHHEKENNCQSCTKNYTNITGIEWPRGNFTIQFCSNVFHLTSAIVIRHKIAINVTGYHSSIMCHSRSQGSLSFNNVTRLWLQDISFHSCGASFGEDIKLATSIYVVKCTDVTIRNLVVYESRGNGLTMIDNDGKLKIKNCTFSGSKFGTSKKSMKTIGSGLFIVLSYCHPTGKKFYPNCQDESIVNSQYHISDCNFSSNVADSNNMRSREFGGGGLCIPAIIHHLTCSEYQDPLLPRTVQFRVEVCMLLFLEIRTITPSFLLIVNSLIIAVKLEVVLQMSATKKNICITTK